MVAAERVGAGQRPVCDQRRALGARPGRQSLARDHPGGSLDRFPRGGRRQLDARDADGRSTPTSQDEQQHHRTGEFRRPNLGSRGDQTRITLYDRIAEEE